MIYEQPKVPMPINSHSTAYDEPELRQNNLMLICWEVLPGAVQAQKAERQRVPKILLVDDDETLRSSLARFLINEGYAVESAACGEDALQMLGAYQFDAIVLDWALPDVSG